MRSSNTAQVLTSLAEAVVEGRKPPESAKSQAVSLLKEALEIFQRCLDLQEFKYSQAQDQAADVDSQANIDDVKSPGSIGTPSDASEEEVWASVEVPITQHALFDTVSAQLSTLTTLCRLAFAQEHSEFAWIEENYRNVILRKLNTYAIGSNNEHEAALAKAKFTSALSDVAFRHGNLELRAYEQQLTAAFSDPAIGLTDDAQGLYDRAGAELTFDDSVQTLMARVLPAERTQICTIRWKHITRALESLTAASKIPSAPNLPRIHIRRGDCEMLRVSLGEEPFQYSLAIKSLSTLLKNAEVYYRGASAFAKRSAAEDEEQRDAEVKEAVVLALEGDAQRLVALAETEREYLEETIEEMREEGLLGDASLGKIAEFFS